MWLPIQIDERRPEPLYHQITSQLRGLILSGQLVEHAALPSIRELAALLRCSAITIRRVYQDLESEGLIRTRQGSGTFVAGVPRQDRDRHRLRRATEELSRAIDAGLQLQCSPEELETIFKELIENRKANHTGGISHDIS